MDEETRLYKVMLEAHTEAIGEPSSGHKRYLWGLAKAVVDREELRLVYSVWTPGQVLAAREINDRILAEDQLARTSDGWLEVRWSSRWAPDDPELAGRMKAQPRSASLYRAFKPDLG